MKCIHCGSENTIKYGLLLVVKGNFQKYRCIDCRRVFADTTPLPRDYKEENHA
jgi:transposase-like protein